MNSPLPRICPLKRELPWYLPQKDEIIGDPDRPAGKVHWEMAAYLGSFEE